MQSSRAIIFAFIAIMFAGVAFAAPARIVSTSLCGDAYVLALAEPQNITALSWQANTKLSSAPNPLRVKNFGRADAESLVALDPDVVVMGPGDPVRAARAVQNAGAAVISLNWTEDFTGIFTNFETLGAALNRQGVAQQRIDEIKTRLAVMQEKPKPNLARPRVLYLAPGGASAGSGVFVDQAIVAAGGINHGETLGIKGWGRIPLEKLALAPPDLILTSFFNNGYPSVVDIRSRHPLLAKMLKNVPTVNIPARHWVCAGPHLIEATEEIAGALRRLKQGDRP